MVQQRVSHVMAVGARGMRAQLFRIFWKVANFPDRGLPPETPTCSSFALKLLSPQLSESSAWVCRLTSCLLDSIQKFRY